MNITAIIPSRYGSTRFPGKPLAIIGGKPMVQHVYEQVSLCEAIDRVIIATDDNRIANLVRSFGGEVMMTRTDHPSGTDRIAEVAAQYPDIDVVVNVQGDEPFIQPGQIEQLCRFFQDEAVDIATLAHPISEIASVHNPNVVKALFASSGKAIYFSRAAVPHVRGYPKEQWLEHSEYYQHIGMYAYRREVLLSVTTLAPSRLERVESLEQLRWLEAGYTIYVGTTVEKSIGIDTPEDLEEAEEWWQNKQR